MLRRSTVLAPCLLILALLQTACVGKGSQAALNYQTKSVPVIRPAAELSPAEQRAQSRFALNGTKLFHIPEQIDGLVEQRFGWLEDLGVHWDRIDLWWHLVEPRDGEWDFSRADLAFDTYEKHGVQWYPILCYGAAWFDGHTGPRNDEEMDQFVDYVRQTVTRYRGRAPYWSMWNEPNIPMFWSPEPNPEAYAELTKRVYPVFKAADPDAKLCAPVLAPLGTWDRKFTERLYQAGIKDSFDVFDYHYYRSHPPEREVPRELAEIRAVMARYGDRKPIWISESGVSEINVGAERQAAYVVRNHLITLALGVEKFFYFDLQNWYDDKDDVWDSQLGLVTASGTKKPAYFAYRTMVAEVDHHDIVGRCEGLGEKIEGVLLRDPATGEYTLAVWQTEDFQTRTIDVACGAGEVRVVPTEGGEPLTFKAAEAPRTLVIDATMYPAFVHGVDPMAYLPMAGVTLTPAHTIVSWGEERPLAIEVHPFLENPEVEVLSVDAPMGMAWNPTAGTVSIPRTLTSTMAVLWAGNRPHLTARLAVTHGPPTDRRTVELERTATFEITSRLDVVFRPYVDENGKFHAEARIANRTAEPIEGIVTLEQQSNGARTTLLELPRRTLAANEAVTLELGVTPEMTAALSDTAHWSVSFAGVSSKPVGLAPMRLSDAAPIVDGDLAEWEGLPAMRNEREDQLLRNHGVWTPANASVAGRVWFTPDTLFVAADILDNDPAVNDNAPHQMWRGDAVELYVGFTGPSRRTVLDKSVEFQIGLAARSSETGPVAFWFHKDVVIEDATVASRRTPGGYTLEAAIPLRTLGVENLAFEDGTLIGLDMTLDDLDAGDWAPAGNEPGRAIVWNGTSMNWIDPSGWGIGVLKRE
ncbi:MAG: polysaccharide biosynthesis protein PslG [Candidatus Sumerlaeota bacterium]|nr:polysaccharide biosynthesis protein PslG [Candidatus Sumerlaeota bacterium]